MINQVKNIDYKMSDILEGYNERSDSDDSIIQEEDTKKHNEYKENVWPPPPEEPKGCTFKGKSKLMANAVGKCKGDLKKENECEYEGFKYNVLDVKKNGGATQIMIEISSGDGRGNAVVDFWGPNNRKECTVMVKKSGEHDAKYVKIRQKNS